MIDLRFTLLGDGTSDAALIPILSWILRQKLRGCTLQPAWADLRRLPRPPRSLTERITSSIDLYPCELLFVHRDSESESHEFRLAEIKRAVDQARTEVTIPPAIPVVPIRMHEAWLLGDQTALRRAAGNPNGKDPLDLPKIADVERIPDPKTLLFELLRNASGLTGRRRKRFSVAQHAYRVAELIEDFSHLRTLSAFQGLEISVQETIRDNGWNS